MQLPHNSRPPAAAQWWIPPRSAAPTRCQPPGCAASTMPAAPQGAARRCKSLWHRLCRAPLLHCHAASQLLLPPPCAASRRRCCWRRPPQQLRAPCCGGRAPCGPPRAHLRCQAASSPRRPACCGAWRASAPPAPARVAPAARCQQLRPARARRLLASCASQAEATTHLVRYQQLLLVEGTQPLLAGLVKHGAAADLLGPARL